MSEEELVRPSPGLNMDHGFMKKIERNQHFREQQNKEDASKKIEVARMARKVGMPTRPAKPTLEIYRPPSLRGSGDGRGYYCSSPASPTPPAELAPPPMTTAPTQLQYMNTNGNYNVTPASPGTCSPPFSPQPPSPGYALQQSQSKPSLGVVSPRSISVGGPIFGMSLPNTNPLMHTSKVHFQLQVPNHQAGLATPIMQSKQTSGFSLKRSKSLGAGDIKLATPNEYDLGGFGPDVQAMIRKSLDDPNMLSPRQLMELVRHIFNRVLDSSRYAEPAARLCSTIIEKEKTETFLESLLNSCREWYHERDRLLLRTSASQTNIPSSGVNSSSPNYRWIAYVTFVYEMYARLKTRQRSSAALTGASAATAGPTLLSLLCECCHVFLKPPAVNNLSEIECLFFVLTSIGRDLENELPQRMHQLVGAVRDAFVNPSLASFIRKTLLQLIELQASNWQLTTPAVTYYYPRSHEPK